MSRASVRVVKSSGHVRRPVELALLACVGVIFGIVLAIVAGAMVAYKIALGIPLMTQMIDIVCVVVVPFSIVWFFWGLWDVMQSAWWSHVIGGPLVLVGSGAVWLWRDVVVNLLVRGLPVAVHQLVETGFVWSLWILFVLETITIFYLLNARRVFGIGTPKPLWERHRL